MPRAAWDTERNSPFVMLNGSATQSALRQAASETSVRCAQGRFSVVRETFRGCKRLSTTLSRLHLLRVTGGSF